MNKDKRYTLGGWLSRGTDDIARKQIELAEESFGNLWARLGDGRDALGDYLKDLEGRETRRRIMPGQPFYVRLDGSNFSSFTRKMSRPYDERLSRVMIEVTKALVDRTKANLGYTQSDEISLGFWYPKPESEAYLGGRIQKLVSKLSGMTSALFMAYGMKAFPEAIETQLPYFDSRVYEVPGIDALAACFVWRELDATKNAVSMAARSMYSTKQLFRKSSAEMQEMMFAKGVNFNDYPVFFKRGTYVRRVSEIREFTTEELAAIPEFKRPKGPVMRRWVSEIEIPPRRRVANPVGVMFAGDDPQPLRLEA